MSEILTSSFFFVLISKSTFNYFGVIYKWFTVIIAQLVDIECVHRRNILEDLC